MKLILTLAFVAVLISGLESTIFKKPQNSEECVCLHGGTCIYHRTYRRPYRCACPIGYTGQNCERDLQAACYKDRGQDYRGIVSKTTHNYDCLRWDSPLLRNHYFNAQMKDALTHGLGKHNYCRNPENGMRPWCYFRGPKGVSTMFCQIPKCEPEKTTVSTTVEKPEPTCGRRQNKLYKIIGGMSSAVESHPWIATLYQISRRSKQQFFQCGGTLIHPCWVVTAAHCFADGEIPEPKDYAIILGKANLDETNEFREQKFLVEKIIRHQHYSDHTNALDNDIALVKIRSKSGECAAMTDQVQTICLPPSNLELEGGTKCEIAGFGKESYDSIKYSQVLKSSVVQIIPQKVCQAEAYYGKLINNNMFCAGDPAWKVDACKGDSGGPLICQHNDQMVLYGVISWGDECAKENKPGVYTRMTNYLNWIQENMAESASIRDNFLIK